MYKITQKIFLIFCLFCSVSDEKSCFSVRKSIFTSERRAEHPFAGTDRSRHWDSRQQAIVDPLKGSDKNPAVFWILIILNLLVYIQS